MDQLFLISLSPQTLVTTISLSTTLRQFLGFTCEWHQAVSIILYLPHLTQWHPMVKYHPFTHAVYLFPL